MPHSAATIIINATVVMIRKTNNSSLSMKGLQGGVELVESRLPPLAAGRKACNSAFRNAITTGKLRIRGKTSSQAKITLETKLLGVGVKTLSKTESFHVVNSGDRTAPGDQPLIFSQCMIEKASKGKNDPPPMTWVIC